MTSHLSRLINRNRKIYAYRNLRRDCLSLQQDGLIVGYAEAVILIDVEFRVRESGRQRVLREQRKNVHAFAIGLLEEAYTTQVFDRNNARQVSYNPYRFSTFFNVETLEPIHSGKRVLVTTKGIWIEINDESD